MTALTFAAMLAANVFLNGQNITGITNTTFENCTVNIDEKGNVHITAKGYAVQTMTPTPPPPPPPVQEQPAEVPKVITRRYYMVTEQTERGGAQYDIDLYVNAKWVRKLRSEDEQIVVDITKHLRPGPNKVVLSATKNLAGGRRSMSPAVKYNVIIGEGNESAQNVMIDNPLIEYSRTAADMESSSQEFTLNAR